LRLDRSLKVFLAAAGCALAFSLWRFLPATESLGRPMASVSQGAPVGADAPPAPQAEASTEPTAEDCDAAVAKSRDLAKSLARDHPSRYIAERYLLQSKAEAGNGEFDDCLYWAERAYEEVHELRHDAHAKFKVLQPDELPKQEQSPPAAPKATHARAESRPHRHADKVR
jgi:hypothetical protein